MGSVDRDARIEALEAKVRGTAIAVVALLAWAAFHLLSHP